MLRPPGPPPLSLTTDRPRRRTLISLTPLVDVVFILLIFFMLASSFLDWRSIALDAPPDVAVSGSLEGSVLVEVRSDGLRLSGEAVAPSALAARLRSTLQAKPDRAVLVKPAAGVPFQDAVTVLDRLAAAGVANMSLLRDRPR